MALADARGTAPNPLVFSELGIPSLAAEARRLPLRQRVELGGAIARGDMLKVIHLIQLGELAPALKRALEDLRCYPSRQARRTRAAEWRRDFIGVEIMLLAAEEPKLEAVIAKVMKRRRISRSRAYAALEHVERQLGVKQKRVQRKAKSAGLCSSRQRRRRSRIVCSRQKREAYSAQQRHQPKDR